MITIAIIGSLIAVGVGIFVTLFLAMMFRTVVETNEVHIVQTAKSTKSYGKGYDNGNSYYAWPSWIPKIGMQKIVLPLSVFDEELNAYDAYDVGKVPFVVDIKAFFRIDNPNLAAERVSDLTELREQLRANLQGAVRTILAREDIDAIMMERSKFGDMFTEEVGHQLAEWGVKSVKNIELMDIRDGKGSKTISNLMAKKESLIDMESRQEVAENNKNAEIAEIDAKRAQDVRQQEADQLVGQRTADKEKEIGISNELANQAIKEQAKTTAEKDMAVKQVEHVRQAEINKEVRLVQADEQRQVDITETEGEKQKVILIAEGDLKNQQLAAEGILAVGTSEAEAKKLNEMALVTPQIELAREIGENEGYQTYLIQIREVEKQEVVGVEQAKALQDAGIKVIANTGNVSTGVDSVMDLFSSKGGTALGGAVEAFAQTEQGAAVLKALNVNSSEG